MTIDFANRLEWADSFNLGIEAIDRQHKEMLELINEVGDSLWKDDISGCQKRAREFLCLMSDHFGIEERHLVRLDYPLIERHAAEHRRLITVAQHLDGFQQDGIAPAQAARCFDQFLKLLVSDLLESDVQYKSYLQEAGCIEKRAN